MSQRIVAAPPWVALALWVALLGQAAGAGPVNETLFGVAMHGYDPVAYFDEGEPREGSKEFTFEWKGATWRFASAAHRDRFRADPEAYAPRYGGYCAYAVAHGQTADGDPAQWAIVDGALYLNLNADIKKRWEADRARFIRDADQSWPRILAEQ